MRAPSDIAKTVAWLSKIGDPESRDGILGESMETWAAQDLVALFLELTDAIHQVCHRSVYISLVRVHVSRDPIPEAVKQEVYSLAAARGRRDAVRILLPVPAERALNKGELRVDPALAELPLGMLKWKARGRNPELLSRLAMVPHPDVVSIWLANPRTTESEVLRVAAHRPAAAVCLTEILKSKRWATRSRLHEALAQNPCMPSNVAAGLLHLLSAPLLEQVALTGVLHDLVRETAREIVERRRAL
ncbi:MAG: hypothetical protein ABIK09_05660 [Pseudomonadota bacterium]